MPGTIDNTKLNQFKAYAPAGAGVKLLDDAEKTKKVDNGVSEISFFESGSTGIGAPKAFLKADWSKVEDKGRLDKVLTATAAELDQIKTHPDKFATFLDEMLKQRKDYFFPAFGSLEGAPTRYKFTNIIGLRSDQFLDEGTKLANELYPAGAQRDAALFAINTRARDLYNRTTEFDQFEINGYASFGHDATFLHVYEAKLAALEKIDTRLVSDEIKTSIERQKKQIQGEIDDIFRHKYVYNSSSMFEVNAEESIGLCAIDKGSRQRVSEKASTAETIVPEFEILNVMQGGQNRPVFYDAKEKKYFFDKSSEPVPADLIPQITRQDVDVNQMTFRRAVSGEQLRENFRFDWNGDGYVQNTKIDWVSWGGHCNDKAALEAAGVVVPQGHAGVYEYTSASGDTTHYDRDKLNELLLSYSELGSELSNKTGGRPVKDLGATEFASARDDDLPDRLVLGNGRKIPLNRRDGAFTISKIEMGGKTYNAEEAFQEYIVAPDKKSAKKNDLYSETTEGDYVNLKLGNAKITASAKIQVFDEHSGYVKEESKSLVIDFANPPAEPILVDSVIQDPAKREYYEIFLDAKKKEWGYQLYRMEKQADGKFKKVKVGNEAREAFDPKNLVGQRETSLDNPSTYLPFIKDAQKTGKNATAETADGSGVWNGRMLSLAQKLEMREGGWERVGIDISARYGGNNGGYLAKLNERGEPEFFVPLKMPADFMWRSPIRFAPEMFNLVNSTSLERGLVTVESGIIKTDAVSNMMELLHCAFNNRPYTIVHEGKRYFFETKEQWQAEVAKLEEMRKGVFTGGTVDPGPGPGPVVNGVFLEKVGVNVAKDAIQQFEITAEADGPITLQLNTKSGDADLYVKKGGPATQSDHTLKSWESDLAMDSITIDAKKGEKYGIAVHGYKESSFDLKVTGPRTSGPAEPEPERVNFHKAGRVTRNQKQEFQITAPADGELKIAMSGSGDADIYLKIGEKPTTTKYDFRPYKDGTEETGTLKVKKGDVIYGMVRGYAPTSDYDVNITS